MNRPIYRQTKSKTQNNHSSFYRKMSSFPPDQWQVRYLKDMDSLEGTQHADRAVSLEALMAIKPADGEEGSFRFTLAGTDHIKLRINVQDILGRDIFKDMYLEIQLELGTQVNKKYINHKKIN